MKKLIRSGAALLLALSLVMAAALPARAFEIIDTKPYVPGQTGGAAPSQTSAYVPPADSVIDLTPVVPSTPGFTPINTHPYDPPATEPEETEPEETEETQAQEEILPSEEAGDSRALPGKPLYFQTDYPNTRYGNGSIATSGCGIVSLAMVANYMTGHEYTPEQLAKLFGGYNASNTDRMLNAAKKLQIPYRMAKNWHDARDALMQGNPVIILENELSKFTQGQHFIVAWEMTDDGRVMIHDSYEPNYDKWDMKDGFKNGFTQSEICAGYSGAWIFEMDAMPEEPFIYTEPEKPYIEPRYPSIKLTLEQENLLARMVWVESRGESDEGQQAVAEVVLNRMVSGNFPNTVRDVIYDQGQFRSVPYLDDAEPNQTQYDAIERALYGPYVLPIDVVFFAQGAVNDRVWGTIGGHVFCYEYE